MIEESYVSFETAKMLKEAGFDVVCRSFYEDNDLTVWNMVEHPSKMNRWLPRPTQSLAARWLREVHHIHAILTPLSDGWMYDLYDLKKYQYIILSKDAGLVTYESAFEEALQEALQLIIKNNKQ